MCDAISMLIINRAQLSKTKIIEKLHVVNGADTKTDHRTETRREYDVREIGLTFGIEVAAAQT